MNTTRIVVNPRRGWRCRRLLQTSANPQWRSSNGHCSRLPLYPEVRVLPIDDANDVESEELGATGRQNVTGVEDGESANL